MNLLISAPPKRKLTEDEILQLKQKREKHNEILERRREIVKKISENIKILVYQDGTPNNSDNDDNELIIQNKTDIHIDIINNSNVPVTLWVLTIKTDIGTYEHYFINQELELNNRIWRTNINSKKFSENRRYFLNTQFSYSHLTSEALDKYDIRPSTVFEIEKKVIVLSDIAPLKPMRTKNKYIDDIYKNEYNLIKTIHSNHVVLNEEDFKDALDEQSDYRDLLADNVSIYVYQGNLSRFEGNQIKLDLYQQEVPVKIGIENFVDKTIMILDIMIKNEQNDIIFYKNVGKDLLSFEIISIDVDPFLFNDNEKFKIDVNAMVFNNGLKYHKNARDIIKDLPVFVHFSVSKTILVLSSINLMDLLPIKIDNNNNTKEHNLTFLNNNTKLLEGSYSTTQSENNDDYLSEKMLIVNMVTYKFMSGDILIENEEELFNNNIEENLFLVLNRLENDIKISYISIVKELEDEKDAINILYVDLSNTQWKENELKIKLDNGIFKKNEVYNIRLLLKKTFIKSSNPNQSTVYKKYIEVAAWKDIFVAYRKRYEFTSLSQNIGYKSLKKYTKQSYRIPKLIPTTDNYLKNSDPIKIAVNPTRKNIRGGNGVYSYDELRFMIVNNGKSDILVKDLIVIYLPSSPHKQQIRKGIIIDLIVKKKEGVKKLGKVYKLEKDLFKFNGDYVINILVCPTNDKNCVNSSEYARKFKVDVYEDS